MFSVPPCERSLGSRVACSEVELTKVVTRELPFTRTVDPCVKFIPLTFSVSALLPAGRLGGETVPPAGGGLFTTKVARNDMPTPGFVTMTTGLPARAMALAGMLANNCAELTYVVGSLFRLKLIMELGVKPVPTTVSMNAGSPA